MNSLKREEGAICEEATIEHPLSTHSASIGTRWSQAGYLHALRMCAVLLVLLFTLGVGEMWGTETICKTLDFSDSDFRSGNGTTSQATTWTATKSTTTWSIYGFHNNNWGSSWTKIRAGSKKSKAGDAAKTGTGTISTSFSCSEAITKVVVTTASCAATSDRKLTGTKIVLASNSTFTENVVEYTGPTTATSNEMTFTVTTPTANRYYKLSFTWYNNTTGTAEVIEVSKVEYYYQEASCSANPSIGDASLNGSISLSSIPLSISSVGGGTDCTLAEYGFVWKASSAPSASDNKTKIGESSSATSFSGNITGSFSTGVTYYIKGYAINNGPNTTLSSTALPITPQSVTFNSNGGSSVSTAYVNNGATVSKPSNPTKTGYTFGTWQLSGSDYNFSTTVTDNITLDATWNVKTTAITLSKNNSDAAGSSDGSVNYTYAQSTKDSYTTASRTGYTLNGYYTATSGGTKILNADGTIAGNSIVVNTVDYTDASGNWAYDGTSLTLYAQWTPINYTVTWKVNGEEWSGKGGSTNANYNTAWSALTLPTAPDPDDDGCGQKFVGWTTTENYSNATTAPTDLLNSDNKSGKTAVKITDDVVFYAVFADYDE